MSDVEDRNRSMATRWFHEIWNERNPEAARELWRPGAVGHMEGLPPLTLDDFLDFQAQLLGAFSDFRLDLLDVIVSGERVVVEWCIRGTHDGPLLGIPPSGRTIEEYGLTKFIVKDGQMAEGWDRWNIGAMLDRLARPSAEEIVERHGLTPRQAEVALLLANGASSKSIAKGLGIRLNTARRHCQAVLRRLGLDRRGDVAEAIGKVDIAVSGPHSPTHIDDDRSSP